MGIIKGQGKNCGSEDSGLEQKEGCGSDRGALAELIQGSLCSSHGFRQCHSCLCFANTELLAVPET